MAKPGRRKKPKPPKFPRRRWSPGQTERVEEPKRGAGYHRHRERRDAGEEVDDSLAERRDNHSNQETANGQ
ncbi:MAG: hypothetical protein AMK72_10435 [Planctomycetes bacterium SM23_25]|nr:MAG: hypothetical protein AMK72_10435 [Planctomycetes bacterium SM23_25]